VFGMDMLRDKIEQCICQRAMGPLTASAERSKNRAEVTGRELLALKQPAPVAGNSQPPCSAAHQHGLGGIYSSLTNMASPQT